MNTQVTAIQPNQATETIQWAEFLSSQNDGSQWLYMLIDAAHDSRILTQLEKSSHARSCLFSEDYISDALKAVSPFLIKIKKIDDFAMWCLSQGVHRHWMLFFTSSETHVSELRLHFKRFSIAHTPEGKKVFFRYYDPRVLSVFLGACDPRERESFFRLVKKVWMPRASSAGAVQLLELEAEGEQKVLQIPVPSCS